MQCNEKKENANLRGKIVSNSIGSYAWQKHQWMIPGWCPWRRKVSPKSHLPVRFVYLNVVKLVSSTAIWLLLLLLIILAVYVSLECSFGKSRRPDPPAAKWKWEFGYRVGAGRIEGMEMKNGLQWEKHHFMLLVVWIWKFLSIFNLISFVFVVFWILREEVASQPINSAVGLVGLGRCHQYYKN